MHQSRTDRPTPGHIVWQADGGEDDTRIDPEALTEWADSQGHDIRQPKHTDEDRASDPRHQLQCVFSWQETETQTLTMGQRTWELDVPEQPERYIEIDTEGMARIVTWEESVVVTLESLRADGDSLVLTGEEFFGEKRLNGRELADWEPLIDRETSSFW